jgi:3-hydroxyisobutyrate dehydrogenase-like beta-hydroxyacid dehydrogenase
VAEKREVMGFIGLGVMGGRMARRLLAHGYPLIVHDVNAQALKALVKLGARAARNAREVANHARTVFVSLPAPAVLREVALGEHGVIRGKKAKTLIDLSTTGCKVEKEVAAGLRARGITLLDAPVSGGATGAAKGTLAVMVAGDAKTIDSVRDALAVLGKVFVVGKAPGQAQMMKLLNNLLSQSALAMSLEVFVAGVKAGLDPDLMAEVINANFRRVQGHRPRHRRMPGAGPADDRRQRRAPALAVRLQPGRRQTRYDHAGDVSRTVGRCGGARQGGAGQAPLIRFIPLRANAIRRADPVDPPKNAARGAWRRR